MGTHLAQSSGTIGFRDTLETQKLHVQHMLAPITERSQATPLKNLVYDQSTQQLLRVPSKNKFDSRDPSELFKKEIMGDASLKHSFANIGRRKSHEYQRVQAFQAHFDKNFQQHNQNDPNFVVQQTIWRQQNKALDSDALRNYGQSAKSYLQNRRQMFTFQQQEDSGSRPPRLIPSARRNFPNRMEVDRYMHLVESIEDKKQ